MRRRLCTVALVAAVLVPLGRASATPGEKTEAPARAVTRLARSFATLESYAAACEVKGGVGSYETGEITAASVSESWTSRVVGPLARIDGGVDVYRPRQGAQPGTIREGTTWKGLNATEAGRKLDRLFLRPEVILAQVAQAKATARWIAPAGGQGAGAPPPPELQDEGADEAGDVEPDSKTKERGKEDPAAIDWSTQAPDGSHHLQVTGSATTAITFFNSVSNTCFGGG